MNRPLLCYECHDFAAGHLPDIDDIGVGRDLVCRVHGSIFQRQGGRVDWFTRKPIQQIVVCEDCGGMRVEWESWVDINRDVPTDSIDSDQRWCPRCQDHVGIIYLGRAGTGWTMWLYRCDAKSWWQSIRSAIRAVRSQGTNRRLTQGLSPRGKRIAEMKQPKEGA